MKEQAQKYLEKALNNSNASFHQGQWEAIEQLFNKKRILVVQRTGWGKSMVYLLATKILRTQNKGPTLLISPLLSLMRNQIEMAQRIGVKAETINSANSDEWDTVEKKIKSNEVDILLISPERLSNDNFQENILPYIKNIALLVIDEAHCISDWGHDFRPDYRKITRIIQNLPPNIPVLATTATANNRVVEDIATQLGNDIIIQRGTLARASIKLQNINMPSSSVRMAWLAENIPSLPGSGIVYVLTKHDAAKITKWLRKNEIEARQYDSSIEGNIREILEQQLLNNKIKVLVATTALGMGFDKPDLSFVIHYQRPHSVVHYYQQVGRAGRSVNNAFGILLNGIEDNHIAEYFMKNAFPSQYHITTILKELDKTEQGLSLNEISYLVNLTKGQIEKTLKFLVDELPSPVIKNNTRYYRTPTTDTYKINQEHIDRIIEIRKKEREQMNDYMQTTGCLMAFLQKALDDPKPESCTQCSNCRPQSSLDKFCNDNLVNKANQFLRRSYQIIEPRKRWAKKDIFESPPLGGSNISDTLQMKEGRVLSLWNDDGWGKLVSDGKYVKGYFSDELVNACADMIKQWGPSTAPQWVTCIPSKKHPELVHNFAIRLSKILNLHFEPCIKKIRSNKPQKDMNNSYQQNKNLDGVFEVSFNSKDCYSPCLLVDDIVNSRWTFTVAAALLQQKGCRTVYPIALASKFLK